MDFGKLYLLFDLICTITAVDSKRWYSATVVSSEHIDDRFKTKQFQIEQNYAPVAVQDIRNKFNLKAPDMTNKVKPYISENGNDVPQETSPKYAISDTIHLTDENKPLNSISKPIIPLLTYNNTMYNINILKTTKPKRKIIRRRCPTMKPRQKKQLNHLNLNQTAKTRFLEVFEVVEFEHVACTSSSGLEGTCLPEYDCQVSGGISMGSCADGYGTCCVTQFSCDDHSSAPAGWFTNPGFPGPSTDRLSCSLTLDKSSADVKQIRLDFVNFELLPPVAGTCEHDQFVVTGQNVNNVIPILCGVNTGQHVYIEVGDVEGPVIISVQTVSSDTRLFSIKVTQLTSSHEMAAPSGCLQYFKGPQGYLESFNYKDKSDISIARFPSYMNNMNYAICIERVPKSCSITYSNSGTMQVVNYDTDGLPVLPPGQAGVEIFNCPTDYVLFAATRLCGDRLNDGSVLQDFALDAPVTDIAAGPIIVWFRSDGGYIGRGFKFQYQQNDC